MKHQLIPTVAFVLGLIATGLGQQRNLPEYTNNFRISWYPVNGEEYNRGDVFQMGLDIDQDGWGEFLVSDTDWRLFLIFEAEADDKYVEVYSINMFHNGRIGDHDGDGIPNFYYSAKDCETFVDFEYQGGDIFDSTSYAINHTRIIHPVTNKIMHYSWWSMAQGPLGREWDVDMDRDNKREVVVDSWDTDGVRASGWPCLVVLEAKDEFTTTVKEKRQGALPVEHRLVGSYPNPFNASTRVIYELGTPAEVHLRVYDVSGKLITILDAGRRSAGRHECLWNAQSFSSGLYFVFLESGGFRQAYRMVLLK